MGLCFNVSSNNHIEYNHRSSYRSGVAFRHGRCDLRWSGTGTTVNHNLIHHIRSVWLWWMGHIYWMRKYSVVIENNLVYLAKSAGFHQHYGKDNIIRNNIFAMNTDAQLERTRNENHMSFTFEKNIVYWVESKLLTSNWRENNYKFINNLYYRTDGLPIMFSN